MGSPRVLMSARVADAGDAEHPECIDVDQVNAGKSQQQQQQQQLQGCLPRRGKARPAQSPEARTAPAGKAAVACKAKTTIGKAKVKAGKGNALVHALCGVRVGVARPARAGSSAAALHTRGQPPLPGASHRGADRARAHTPPTPSSPSGQGASTDGAEAVAGRRAYQDAGADATRGASWYARRALTINPQRVLPDDIPPVYDASQPHGWAVWALELPALERNALIDRLALSFEESAELKAAARKNKQVCLCLCTTTHHPT